MTTLVEDYGLFRLVGRISLWFIAVSAVGLIVILYLAGGNNTTDYFEAVRSLSITKQQLPWVMSIGGLLLILGTALTTWLISLYSSFRLAGPLYRFTLDLQKGIDTGQVPTIRIRNTDLAHSEARRLDESVEALYSHFNAINDGVEITLATLEQTDADAGEINDALDKLHAICERNKP